jgi:hypothetical protein
VPAQVFFFYLPSLGANTCEEYDAEEVCKNVSKTSCTWVAATLNTPARCQTAACVDFKDAKKCLATFIGTNLCTWWGATGSCATNECSLITDEDYCKTAKVPQLLFPNYFIKANGIPCFWAAECREKKCSDIANADCSALISLNPTTSCLS